MRKKPELSSPTAKHSMTNRRSWALPKREAATNSKSGAPGDISLLRAYGNEAVQRLFPRGVIQAKLQIGQPRDRYEQEADRVADKVMRMPEPAVQRQEEEEELQEKPLAKQSTERVQRQEEEEELQEKPLTKHGTERVQRSYPSNLAPFPGYDEIHQQLHQKLTLYKQNP